MTFITWFLWILVWGLVGYFTVRTIMIRIEERRRREWLAAYHTWQHYHAIKTSELIHLIAFTKTNPFIDLSTNEEDPA